MSRCRTLIFSAVVLLFCAAASAQVIREIESVGLTVQDMERSVDFFTKVLQFEKVGDQTLSLTRDLGPTQARVVRLRLGSETLELTQYLAAPGQSFPSDARPNDRSFQHVAIVVRDMDAAYAWLRKWNVRHASSAPQTLPETIKPAAGIKAFYFRDPDGHYLEILQFPPDKGAAKWHRVSERLFLGIDHTAIVVADTKSSLRFYRDLLGMTVAGESENLGFEQEHLSGVFGAHLVITALRSESGPGVELLQYLSPTDGRAYPSGTHANDLLHWETSVTLSGDFATAAEKLKKAQVTVMPTTTNEFTGADPDGHMIIFHSGVAPDATEVAR